MLGRRRQESAGASPPGQRSGWPRNGESWQNGVLGGYGDAAAGALRLVHRRVRAPEQVIGAALLLEDGDAEACVENGTAIGDGCANSLDHHPRLRVGGLHENQRELVAADPVREVRASDRGSQTGREAHELVVADEMAGAVVQLLELVEVAEHEREGSTVALRPRGLRLELADERTAIRQPRERIVIGEELQLLE